MFKFKMLQKVKLNGSDESGVVIGRLELQYSDNQYLIRYKAADGRLVETYWCESALIDDE